jgi:hypothetical protein
MNASETRTWSLVLLAIIAAVGCSSDETGEIVGGTDLIEGNGTVVTEDRDVSGVFGVAFETLGIVHINKGTSESLRIETDENLLPHIVAEVSSGTLVLRATPGVTLIPTTTIDFYLTVIDLDSIDLSGVGEIESTGLHVGNIVLENSGVGDINLSDLEVSNISVKIEGVGNIYASGSVNNQVVEIPGLGEYGAAGLTSAEADVTISGSGSVTLCVNDRLAVNITGTGSVSYYGNPTLEGGPAVSLGAACPAR